MMKVACPPAKAGAQAVAKQRFRLPWTPAQAKWRTTSGAKSMTAGAAVESVSSVLSINVT